MGHKGKQHDDGLGALGRAALISAICVLAVCATCLAWAVWEYEQLSGDVGRAQTRLPRQISSVLAQAGATRDSPNVTLVRGYGGLATGGTLLFRSDPDHGQFSFLTIPSPVAGLRASTAARVDSATKRLIRRLGAVDVPVNHVALLNIASIRGIVDALGGITVPNQQAFTVPIDGAQAIHFPVGSLRLDGDQAVAYLSVDATTKAKHAQRERNEAEVLEAVIEAGAHVHDVARLVTTARAIAEAAATDLNAPSILGLVAARLRADRIVRCRLAADSSLGAAEARSAIAMFEATTSASPACATQTVSPPISAKILGLGAATVNRWGVSALVVALLVVIGAIVAAVTLLRSRQRPILATGDPGLGSRAESVRRPAGPGYPIGQGDCPIGSPAIARRQSRDRVLNRFDDLRDRVSDQARRTAQSRLAGDCTSSVSRRRRAALSGRRPPRTRRSSRGTYRRGGHGSGSGTRRGAATHPMAWRP